MYNYDRLEIKTLPSGKFIDETYSEWEDAGDYSEEKELTVVESFGNDYGLIASEKELSERFDEDVLPSLREHWIQYSDSPDYPVINEAFNNWKDALREAGTIHELQDNEYCYVGKYENG
jgi:hypothetical protein